MLTRRNFNSALPALLGAGALSSGARAAVDWRQQYPTIVFGTVTGENAADRVKRYKPVEDYLSSALGVQIGWAEATDYAGIIQGMISHKVQLAHFGPASYAKAWILSRGQVVPVAEQLDQYGNKGYYSVTLVRQDSPYHSIADLKGKTYAFADPNSTSGFQAPSYFLTKEGYPPTTFFGKTLFSGSHENSVMALYHRDIDACSTWYNNASLSNPSIMAKKGMIPNGWWRVIWTSPQLPSDPWAMPTWLPQQMRDDVTKVVLDMPTKGKEAFAVLSSGLSTGFAPGDVKDYQPIIDMVTYNAKHHIGQNG
jgi:phosphonate transport system substrate-binding protein